MLSYSGWYGECTRTVVVNGGVFAYCLGSVCAAAAVGWTRTGVAIRPIREFLTLTRTVPEPFLTRVACLGSVSVVSAAFVNSWVVRGGSVRDRFRRFCWAKLWREPRCGPVRGSWTLPAGCTAQIELPLMQVELSVAGRCSTNWGPPGLSKDNPEQSPVSGRFDPEADPQATGLAVRNNLI